MSRINVFLNEDLLKRVNQKSGRKKRSAFIQKALLEYLEKLEDGERRRKMEKASRQMDKMARRLGEWDPTALIRKLRDVRKGGA